MVASAILADVEPGLPARRNGVATGKIMVKCERFDRWTVFPGGKMPPHFQTDSEDAMKKRLVLAAVIVTLFMSAVWFFDPFFLFLMTVVPLVWIGVPAAFIATILLVAAIRTGRSRRLALRIFSIVGGFACLVFLVIPTNAFVQELAVSDAKAYPSRVAPLLEAYRKEHGVYPASLDQLPANKPSVPRLLRRYGYHSSGPSYSFMFGQPGGLIDTWNYDSETHAWHLST